MPAPRNNQYQYKGLDKIRDSIKAQELVEHLQRKVLQNEKIQPAEIGAAKLLLNKVLPDLRQVELQGALDLAVTGIDVTIKREA